MTQNEKTLYPNSSPRLPPPAVPAPRVVVPSSGPQLLLLSLSTSGPLAPIRRSMTPASSYSRSEASALSDLDRETMAEYRSELKKLAEKVMEVMDENLGLPKGYIKKALNGGGEEDEGAFYGTKVSHYQSSPHPDMVNSIWAHTDAGGVVILFQDDKVKGLQILKDGEWIDMQPLPNAIVINTRDQKEVLSNGRYKSVWHQVLATPDGNRGSVASFYNPSLKPTIAPAPQLLENTKQEAQDHQVDATRRSQFFLFFFFKLILI
ncbi:1-aminocyclopropane-1-carboxylate oxidase 5-like [Malania oleifera]|uniref:1-aminocyclopropane-1-carboxylate oxidase 5-like n=1 Tax=Malania oleifera TaxID=397392 RepID=UPI0025AE5B33|nr:1-aminocyclopropane-1-carboxylate oxidase 5-like [Malania oleifera]